LFSITKTTGSESREARFSDSWTSPVLDEPSPKNAKPTALRPSRRWESVAPATVEHMMPRWLIIGRERFSGSPWWMLPSRALVGLPALAKYWLRCLQRWPPQMRWPPRSRWVKQTTSTRLVGEQGERHDRPSLPWPPATVPFMRPWRKRSRMRLSVVRA
jgi:hypothetical protein